MTGMIDRLASSETLARASVNLNAGALDKQDEMLARVTPEQRAEMVLGPGALRFAQDAEMANAIAANPKDFETLGLLEGTVAAWKAGRHDLEVSTAASGLVRAQQTLDNPQAAVERLRDSISEEDQAIAERLTGVNPVNAYAAIADKESAAYRMMVDRREEQLHKLIDASSRIEEYTRPKIMEKISAAEGFWGSFQAFLEDPINAMLYTGVSSMASQAEWLAASIPAYALGGRLTGAATAGLGSYTVDYGASLVQAMTEAGVDMGDEASVRAWLENPDNVGRAVTEATLHAQGVSAFDFLAGLVAPMNLRMFSGTFGLGRQLVRSARRLNAAGLKPTAIARGVRSTLLRQSPYGKMLDQLFSQAVAGAALGMAGEYTGQRLAGQSINWGDILLEGIGEFFTMPVEAASAHAGLAMRNYKELKHAQFAARAQEMFPKVVEGMRLTNLRKANPGVFKQLAREMGAANGVKEFYISSQDLTSTEGLADAIVQAAPELAEQVRAAVAQGSDVAIPIETLAGPMADNAELINQMKPLVRITPDGMSAREADEFVNSPEIKKFGQAYVEEVIAQRQKDTAFNQELDEVFAPIRDQFLAARSEQITPEVVDKSIAATRMILGSFATRMGLTPKQFAERFPLMVQRVVDSSRAEMMRQGAVPEKDSVTGEVLMQGIPAKSVDAVRTQYKGTPQWMKAPNGQPTKLTEAQWLQVRTPEFKAWFGDWEQVQVNEFVDRAIEGTGEEGLTLEVFVAKEARERMEAISGEKFGRFILDTAHLRHGFETHGNQAKEDKKGQGRGQIAVTKDALKLIPWLLNNFDSMEWHGRRQKGTSFLLRKRINGTAVLCEFFLGPKTVHAKTMWIEKPRITDAVKNGPDADTTETHARPDYKDTVKRILNAKASKVVDENGEPLVVYHVTDANFDTFDLSKARQSSDIPAFYFSTGTEDWAAMGSRVMPCFLNIRNPVEKPAAKGQGAAVREQLIKDGYDGTALPEEGMETEWAAFYPTQIKSAVGNNGMFDPNNPNIFMQGASAGNRILRRGPDNFTPEEQEAFDAYMNSRKDKARIMGNLQKLKDTPWAKQAIEAVFVRQAIRDLMAGKTPTYESALNSGSCKGMRENAAKGIEGLKTYLAGKGILGHAAKPVHNVNSSFLNCNPSPDCAKFCYATQGNYKYAAVMAKAEVITMMIEEDPVWAAEQTVREYKATAEYQNNKALRLFDKGDGDDAWIPFIKEVNRQGVRVQIFSKRPDFLRQVPVDNLRLLSIDKSNIHLAEENPDLPVAFVYSSAEQNDDVSRILARGQLQVVLPVKLGRSLLEEQKVKNLRKAIPGVSPYLCPIDAGLKPLGATGQMMTIERNGKKVEVQAWNCTRCDKNGGCGCFFGKTTEKIGKAIAKVESKKVDFDLLNRLIRAEIAKGIRDAYAERGTLATSEKAGAGTASRLDDGTAAESGDSARGLERDGPGRLSSEVGDRVERLLSAFLRGAELPEVDVFGRAIEDLSGQREGVSAARLDSSSRKVIPITPARDDRGPAQAGGGRDDLSDSGQDRRRLVGRGVGTTFDQSAWHGSPYNFNRFTLDHIGTGEGAQAHGWGLYFALEKAVGRKYRERLKRPLQEYMSAGAHAVNELWERYFSAVVRGKPLNSRAKTDDYGKGAVELLHGVVADFNAAEMFDTATRTRLIEEYIADVQDDVRYGNVDQATADEFRDVAREWLEAVKDLPPHEGALYEVEIPEDDVMLREDALLKDQPPKVRDACRRLIEDLLEQNPEYEDDVGDIDHLMETVTAKTFYDNTQVMLAGFEVDSPQGEMMMARPGDEAKAMSQLLNSYGVKGMRYYSATDGECAVVWDEEAISIRTTLEQGMADEVRGQFDTATGMMTLFEKADESTFLHETGHYFLNAMSEMGMEILNRPAEERTAGESEMVSMLGGFLQWCGIEGATDEERIRNFAAMGQAGDTRFRDAHEKFSRGYEAYVREGNAPVPALRRIFKRFKEWLMRLYRSAEELDVELSPEVRALYSRMFTSEAEARQLAEEADLRNMFGPKKPDYISDEDWQQLNDLYDEAREAAVASVRANRERNFRILTDKYEREKRGVQKEYEAIEKNVREEVENTPVYRAARALTDGLVMADGTRVQAKLSRASLEALGASPEVVQALVDKGYVSDRAEGGAMPAQILSDLVGGGDVLAFMTQLAQAEPLDAAVTAAAQERFLEQYGDFPDEDGVNSAARNQVALHSDAYGKALEREYNLLSRLAKGPKALARLAREVVSRLAHQQVGNLKVRDLKPVINSRAEARAGREARKALAKGDIAAAMDAKRKQMMQHFLAKAGQEARVEIAKAITRVKKTLRSKTIHGAHMAQLENLAAVFGLADREFNTQTPPLRAFVEEAATEQGFFFEFDDVVFAEGDVPYQALTIEQFRAVMEAFDQIAHTGRERQSVTINGQKVRTADAVKAARESIEQHAAEKGREFKVEWSGEKPPRFAGLFRFMRNHVKVSSWTRIMDGAQDGGIMWQLFTRRANQCGDKETELRARLTRHLMEVLEPLYKGPKLDEAVASISVTLTDKAGRQTTAPRTITRLERFVMALNWGNDGNRQRLRDGFGLTDETVGEILAGMTEAEWRCVEGVWKTFESLRPEMEALETRIYGRPPQWIEYSPFRVKAAGGREIEVSGGYYPAMYDLSVDSLANERDAAKEAERMMQNAFTAVRTDRSHMKKRAARNYQPMDLRLSSMFDAINSEVHDLCWREFVIDSERLLRGGLKDTIRGFYSNDVQRIFQNWVKDLALGDKRARGLEGEEWASRLRQGVGLAGLGFNIVSALAQTTGILATASRLGTATLRGVSMYARNPIAATREACEESTFMRNRSITRFRELNEVANRIRGKSEIIEGAQKYGYWLLLKVQQVVDVTTWHGAYAKAIGEGRSHEDAVALADQCVIDTQGGGELKDLSQIERGGYMAKLFTVFYAFMNTAFNLNAVSILGEKSKAKAAAQILTLSVVMPVLEQIIRAAMPAGDAGYGDADDKDDEQTRYYKWLRRAVGDIVEFNLGTIVGAREVSTSLGNVIAGEMAWDWRGPSGARVLYDTNALIKRLPKIATGEFDVATIKAISNWMGATMGLPSAQLNRLLATYQGVQKGKLDGPADIARGVAFGVRLQK